MKRLNPEKLHVTYSAGTHPDILDMPRCYTLTHSDTSGELFLTIGCRYCTPQISGFYTKLMRDEVLAEITAEEGKQVFKVYCHVSGGFTFGTAGLRNRIFRAELPLALEAIRYGDRALFEVMPDMDRTPVRIYFKSTKNKYNRVEGWGVLGDYR